MLGICSCALKNAFRLKKLINAKYFKDLLLRHYIILSITTVNTLKHTGISKF